MLIFVAPAVLRWRAIRVGGEARVIQARGRCEGGMGGGAGRPSMGLRVGSAERC